MSQSKFTMRHYENLHIPLWLLKDTCWMMQWKYLGMFMIIPTISVAFIIAFRSRNHREVWINSAICFWISANAYWMCAEFYGHEELKYYASIPFGLGFVCTALFYLSKKPHANA